MTANTEGAESALAFDLARHITGDLKLRAARTLNVATSEKERIRIVIAVATEVGAWACGVVHGLTKTDEPVPTAPELFRWLADKMERDNAQRCPKAQCEGPVSFQAATTDRADIYDLIWERRGSWQAPIGKRDG